MINKRHVAAAILAVAALTITGCSLNEGEAEPTNAEDTVLRIGTTTEVSNYNPLQSLSKTDN